MFSVIIVDSIAKEGVALLKQQGFKVEVLKDNSSDNIQKKVIDADALLVRTSKITREIIYAGTKLKVISRHGVGVDNIDLDAATEKGIYVTNTPIASVTSVAEHIIGMIIVLAKHMRKADMALRSGNFEVRNEYIGIELEGKTLGIVGVGKIGKKVGRIATNGLGMKVIGYDPYVKNVDNFIEITESWERVFSDSDFVSLNLPLTESTYGIVGLKEFKMMKRSAYLINCARGPVVKEVDLIEALQQRMIAGAGLDVFEQEPPKKNNPLFSMENTIVTPHMASHSHTSMVKMAVHAAQGIIEVLQDKNPSWPVNKIG